MNKMNSIKILNIRKRKQKRLRMKNIINNSSQVYPNLQPVEMDREDSASGNYEDSIS
jgi:hypothetical protein